jgi:hypothetical protein
VLTRGTPTLLGVGHLLVFGVGVGLGFLPYLRPVVRSQRRMRSAARHPAIEAIARNAAPPCGLRSVPPDHWLIAIEVPADQPLLRDIEVLRAGAPPGLAGFPMTVSEEP